MKCNSDQSAAIVSHLTAEAECLERLVHILGEEASALRQMSLARIDEIARTKEDILGQVRLLANARGALLGQHSDIETFSEYASRYAAEDASDLTEVINRVRELAATVSHRNQLNYALADGGDRLVKGLVRLSDLSKARLHSTYASDGQIRGCVTRNLGDKGRACLA